ncbi:hypothetical protein POPTR_019G049901v4 [Populus trichocarpa]|uniref:Uncharacterized protein n=1 Tax=Populus trichocarpa TaxID=3694 RepID=A0ACC0RK49_POPTR|nr:hypothetical protein POPTR_019G049901v4 [Populus trichocarpa]
MSSVEHCSKTWTGPAVEPFLLLVPAFFNSVFDCCFSQSSLFCFLTYVLFHLLSATLAIVFFNFYDCDESCLNILVSDASIYSLLTLSFLLGCLYSAFLEAWA